MSSFNEDLLAGKIVSLVKYNLLESIGSIFFMLYGLLTKLSYLLLFLPLISNTNSEDKLYFHKSISLFKIFIPLFRGSIFAINLS